MPKYQKKSTDIRNLLTNNSMMQILTWKEARGEVKKASFELAAAIDDYSPIGELKFCKIDYPFGAPIFDQGTLFVPNKNNQFIPINDPTVPSECREFLDYGSAPLGIVLKNCICNSFAIKNNLSSFGIFYPGQVVGLRELFDSNYYLLNKDSWNLYAGVRTIFSTTKISDSKKHEIIKNKFNLQSQVPHRLQDHFFLFRELLNHPHFSCNWKTTLLFLSKSIVAKLMAKKVRSTFQTYFLKQAWEQAIGWHFEAVLRSIWNRVFCLLQNKGFEVFESTAEIFKQIIKISLGHAPCFVSHDQDEVAAPLGLLKEILIDEYKVAFYPTIMIPGYIAKGRYCGGYYSIDEPLFTEDMFIPTTNIVASATLRNIQEMYEVVKAGIVNEQICIGNENFQNLFSLFKETNLSFFHSIPDGGNSLLLTSELPNQDPGLVCLPSKYKDRDLFFDSTSSFFRNVIRVNVGDLVLDKNCCE